MNYDTKSLWINEKKLKLLSMSVRNIWSVKSSEKSKRELEGGRKTESWTKLKNEGAIR